VGGADFDVGCDVGFGVGGNVGFGVGVDVGFGVGFGVGVATGAVVGDCGVDRQPSELEFPNTCVHLFVPVSHAAPKWTTSESRILALCPDEIIHASITDSTLD